MENLAADHPHRRFNPLLGDWILVSPQRTKRPWQGDVQKPPGEDRPHYDPSCYLCPGNRRANGDRNPEYPNTFVFVNDFAAVLPDTPTCVFEDDPLFQLRAIRGEARVICFSPRHDLTLAEMSIEEISEVVDLWTSQTAELGEAFASVQVFENRGAIMGASNPHPHGQIWATDSPGSIPLAEDAHQLAYFHRRDRPLLADYLSAELKRGVRIVLENNHWLVVVPFWALWPFETLLLPKQHVRRLTELNGDQRADLARILKRLLVKYDNLFETSFPYSMGWHGAPFNAEPADHWLLHAHFLPPLLRSATVKKFMVGYEMLAEAQRDITAEEAAQRLRQLSEIHYKLP